VTRTGLFQFVPYPKLPDFLARGWMVVADLGPTHGQWAVLCWHCECGAVSPTPRNHANCGTAQKSLSAESGGDT
jgi:hypothetical protein